MNIQRINEQKDKEWWMNIILDEWIKMKIGRINERIGKDK